MKTKQHILEDSTVFDRMQKPDRDLENRPPITIRTIALPSAHAERILEVGQMIGFGYRQYASVTQLIEDTAPSSVGCVVLPATENLNQYSSTVNQLKSCFMSLPIIVLLDSDSNASTVHLMQLGVFSVLTSSVDRSRLQRTITEAVEKSLEGYWSIAEGRQASFRMQEASDKELEVLDLIMVGKKNKEIALELGITVRAVEDRRFRLMRKVGVESLAELVSTAVSARYYDRGLGAAPATVPIHRRTRKCLRGIEIWKHSEDESHLAIRQSCYHDAPAFRDASQDYVFRRGEGLPGKIWQQRAPVFMDELITTEFPRTGIASAEGMTTAIGFPVFCEGRVDCVILILLDSRDRKVKAAFESWSYDADSSVFKLVAGTFINCEKLRRLSEYVSLPIGQGLPGVCVEQSSPYIGARFADNTPEVRGIAIASEQLLTGAALPLTDSGRAVSDTFLLFNSESTPVFSVLQVWKPISDSGELYLITEFVDGVPTLSSQVLEVAKTRQKGIAGKAYLSGSPEIMDERAESTLILANKTATVPTLAIAIPTLVGGKVVAVTVLAS